MKAGDAPDPRPVDRTLAPGVHQLRLASDTLPPFDHTWVTLLVSGGRAAIVDPGFAAESDADALLAWAGRHGARDVDRVLLTHTHRDHVAGLTALAARLPEPPTVHVHAAEAERVPAGGRIRPIADGRRLVLGAWTIDGLHTPGHAPGHLAFVVRDEGDDAAPGLLAGDLVTGRGAAWVGLPEGDAGAYVASLERVAALGPRWLAPSHGDVPEDPAAALEAATSHRRRRERELLAALSGPARTLDTLTDVVYGDLDPALRTAARASLAALLVHGMRAMRIVHLGGDEEGPYALAPGVDASAPGAS